MKTSKSKDRTDQGRRDFFKKGFLASSIAASTSALLNFHNDEVEESGEKVKLLSPDGDIVEIDSAYLKPVPELEVTVDPGREGIPGKKLVMVIDLSRCKNLKKCQTACQKMHHLSPEKEWLKILRMQDNDITSPYWQPTVCFHCDNPPCVKVCPVDATFKRSDGTVLIDNERCIGCRFCMVACPYSARSFDWSEPDQPEEIKQMEYSPETSCPAKMGTVSKCDFCPDMARKGELPHCVTACPNGVFYFGDENEDAVSNGDTTVKLSQLLKDKFGYRYMEDLGTKPRVYYLPPVNRLFPFEEESKSEDNSEH